MNFTVSDEKIKRVEMLDEVGRKEFEPRAAHWDTYHEYPWENAHRLREHHLFNLPFC